MSGRQGGKNSKGSKKRGGGGGSDGKSQQAGQPPASRQAAGPSSQPRQAQQESVMSKFAALAVAGDDFPALGSSTPAPAAWGPKKSVPPPRQAVPTLRKAPAESPSSELQPGVVSDVQPVPPIRAGTLPVQIETSASTTSSAQASPSFTSKWQGIPDKVEDCVLPARKSDPKEYLTNRVTIRVNHFPIKITFNNPAYFHYDFKIERISKNEKKKKTKGDGEQTAKKYPKRLLQKLLKILVHQLTREMEQKTKKQVGIASDLANNVYSTHELEIVGLQGILDLSKSFGIPDPDPEEDEKGQFTYTLTRAVMIRTQGLTEAVQQSMRGTQNTVLTTELPTIFNAVIKAMPRNPYLSIGRTLVEFPAHDGHSLGRGLRCWPGVSACINPGWKLFLNFEPSFATMKIGGNALNVVLRDFFKGQGRLDPTNVTQWKDRDVYEASDFMRSCKVTYSPTEGKTLGGVVKAVARVSASQHRFEFGDPPRTGSVVNYFHQQYGRNLEYPDGPLLVLRGEKGDKYVPAELCKVKSGQSVNRKLDGDQTTKMLDIARKKPFELERDINRQLHSLGLQSNPLFKKFGMNVEGKMQELQCRVLGAPDIKYKHHNQELTISPDIERGHWLVWQHNFRFQKLPELADNIKWAFLGEAWDDVKKKFQDELFKNAMKCGMRFDSNPISVRTGHLNDSPESHDQNVKQYKQWFTDLKRKGYLLVIVIMPQKPSRLYAQVKQAAELADNGVGLLTQCIVLKSLQQDQRRLPATVQNLLLKINSKLGGETHYVVPPTAIKNKKLRCNPTDIPTLILGADVTHPPPGTAAKDKCGKPILDKDGRPLQVPSYAAVTASMDRSCMPAVMDVRAQAKAGAGALEVVEDLWEIVANFIHTFFQRNRRLPVRILYFRDGVGSGQFKELLHKELRAIRKACGEFDKLNNGPYEPRITFVTVQKRHKTRFFLLTNKGTENALPGTVVDSEIVHSTETDFYLMSHKAIIGTSRPTRYHLLWDDNDFSIDELQLLTYYLCHMYVRCNRPVKIPAVTYYAHWSAARAKVFAEGKDHLFGDLDALNRAMKRSEDFKQRFPMHFI